MQVLLDKAGIDAWLSDKPLGDLLEANAQLLRPYEQPEDGSEAPKVAFHPVDPKMNKLQYDEEDASSAIDLEAIERAGVHPTASRLCDRADNSNSVHVANVLCGCCCALQRNVARSAKASRGSSAVVAASPRLNLARPRSRSPPLSLNSRLPPGLAPALARGLQLAWMTVRMKVPVLVPTCRRRQHPRQRRLRRPRASPLLARSASAQPQLVPPPSPHRLPTRRVPTLPRSRSAL